MTVKTPKLDADIPCYGRQPSNEDAIKIKALLFLLYNGLDKTVNAGWPDFEAIFKKTTLRMKLIFSLKFITRFITILI